jgi:carboxyl-terminal processing protease
VVVARDTSWYSDYYDALRAKMIISDFIIQYMDKNRVALEDKYPDFEAFNRDFSVDRPILDALVEMGEKRGVPADTAGLAHSEEYLRTVLKALIAQKMGTMTDYFRVMNATDEFILRAREVLGAWEEYSEGIE